MLNEEWSLARLIIYGRFNPNLTSRHDLLKAETLVNIQMVGDLNFLEHIEILSNLKILGGDLSELVIFDGHINSVVNIRPVWMGSCFLAVLCVSLHEV